jgi:hypothetical protein
LYEKKKKELENVLKSFEGKNIPNIKTNSNQHNIDNPKKEINYEQYQNSKDINNFYPDYSQKNVKTNTFILGNNNCNDNYKPNLIDQIPSFCNDKIWDNNYSRFMSSDKNIYIKNRIKDNIDNNDENVIQNFRGNRTDYPYFYIYNNNFENK